MATVKIQKLENKSRKAFAEYGYTGESARKLIDAVRQIVDFHEQCGKTYYDSEIVSNYLKWLEKHHQRGGICRNTFLTKRKAIGHLEKIVKGEKINFSQHSRLAVLPDNFEQVLLQLLENKEWGVKERKCVKKYASPFLRWLHLREHHDLSSLDENIVREYLIDCSERMTGSSLTSTRKNLKKLLLFLSGNNTLTDAMNRLFFLRVCVEKRIKPFALQDDIAAALNVIDRNTALGKRDYAMILLATVTSLRAIDIVELTMDAIDWRNGEIRIVQEKTGNALALPLTTDVGKAIEDYLLNARPHSESNNVFLRCSLPHVGLHSESPTTRLKKYCIKAGLSKKWTIHSLRRSIATNMIISGSTVFDVAQTLGHKSIKSTKQYISLDSQNLKKCALDFNGIELTGGSAI
jgi:site-specific recombinase XerD